MAVPWLSNHRVRIDDICKICLLFPLHFLYTHQYSNNFCRNIAAARGGSKSDRSFVWGTGSVGGHIRGTRSAREESLLEKVFVPFVSVVVGVVEVLLSDD